MVIAPWEKRETFPMKSEGKYCGGHLTAEAIKKVQQLPWALWEDGNRHPKEGEVTEQAFVSSSMKFGIILFRIFEDKSLGSIVHNILQIHKNVLWDSQCFSEYSRIFPHSV